MQSGREISWVLKPKSYLYPLNSNFSFPLSSPPFSSHISLVSELKSWFFSSSTKITPFTKSLPPPQIFKILDLPLPLSLLFFSCKKNQKEKRKEKEKTKEKKRKRKNYLLFIFPDASHPVFTFSTHKDHRRHPQPTTTTIAPPSSASTTAVDNMANQFQPSCHLLYQSHLLRLRHDLTERPAPRREPRGHLPLSTSTSLSSLTVVVIILSSSLLPRHQILVDPCRWLPAFHHCRQKSSPPEWVLNPSSIGWREVWVSLCVENFQTKFKLGLSCQTHERPDPIRTVRIWIFKIKPDPIRTWSAKPTEPSQAASWSWCQQLRS